MSQIRILPEMLSNKIAAGEVVERPASVVKELVENAIDAGSTRILVEIEQGGRKLIRVSDNGQGMGRDDALLCLERYATSKINREPDLFAIRTLGFRGEALPSIASVSRFTLVTRETDTDVGTRIEVAGGRITSVSDAGAPSGTMITVAGLFYNTPARRKFLKSINTEMGHIADTIASMALCRPSVQFQAVAQQPDRQKLGAGNRPCGPGGGCPWRRR
jgi:DNA mismatch repair protein MutL